MPNLLSSRKAQFFILSAVVIIMFAFLISQMVEPASIPDTSSIAIMDESFIFNNIVEKARETVEKSKDCEDLKFSLEEYKTFAEEFVQSKNYLLNFNYTLNLTSCPSKAEVNFNYIILQSPRMTLTKSFSLTKSF